MAKFRQFHVFVCVCDTTKKKKHSDPVDFNPSKNLVGHVDPSVFASGNARDCTQECNAVREDTFFSELRNFSRGKFEGMIDRSGGGWVVAVTYAENVRCVLRSFLFK